MPAEIPDIQLDDNWLDEIDIEEINPDARNKGAHDELQVTDAVRRKSSRDFRDKSERRKSNSNQEGPAGGDQDLGRLEDQMNYDHLRRLEQIFEEADQDGTKFA